jgi:hypothetical protein
MDVRTVKPARAVARHLRRSNAAVDRAATRRETHAVLRRDAVVVFSMGKTGTTALTAALASASGRPVVKAHALSRAGIDRRMAKAARLAVVERPRFLWACEEIAEVLGRGGEWDLLCGVRDPVALAVSDHFYGLQRQREVGRDPWIDPFDHGGHLAAIADNLRENFVSLDWFDTELRPLTGIDVYATAFPHADGTATYDGGRFRALVMRAEDLPGRGPRAVQRFLGLDAPLAIERRNEGTAAQPGSAYRRVLEGGGLPGDLLDEVYRTPMARHFYTDDERRAFRARWSGALV